MFRVILAAVAASLLFWAPVATAQQSEASPRQLELAGRYVELTMLGDLGKTMEILVEQAMAEAGDLEGAEAAFMRQQMPRLLQGAMSRAFEGLVPLYARTYSEAELTALVAFYESAIGRSVAEKAIVIAVEEQGLIEAEMTRFLTELMEKYCAEFGCGDGPGARQMGK